LFKNSEFMGSQHTLNITYQTPQETLQETPTVLPTTEPGTATFSYTVATGDLPTFDGVPLSQSFVALLYASGLNTTAIPAIISYRIKKNGASLVTSTATAAASQYWTLCLFNASLVGVVAGDVLDVYLWQTTTNALGWSWQGFAVNVSRIQVEKASKLHLNMIYTISGSYPIFINGTVYSSGSNVVTPAQSSGAVTMSLSNTRTFNAIRFYSTGSYAYRAYYGDLSASCFIANHASNHPYYYNNYKITSLSWIPSIDVP